MRKTTLILILTVAVVFLASAAVADWDVEDGHKMHFPQLPDPNGWDVDVTRGVVADDWQCSWSGPIDDIHFWISAEEDYLGNGIDFIDVAIYDDVPASMDPPMWSHPGTRLWSSRVQDLDNPDPGDKFTIRGPETGNQGWYTPQTVPPYWNRPDHCNYYQINITDIVEPLDQEVGKIYWLEIHIIPNAVDQGECPFFGWKTTLDHWNDDAVYMDAAGNWIELYDPSIQEPDLPVSLDMAFVITPEPATLSLLALGGVALLWRRKK